MRIIRGLLILSILIPSSILCIQDYHHYNDFYKPVVCSPTGIKQFLTRTYNQPVYGRDFLPNNFCHLIQFLQHGKQNNLAESYVRSVIRLFNNKLKSSSYINAYAFGQLLKELPGLLEDYFTIYKSNGLLSNLKNTIYDTLFGSFKTNFSSFKKSPTTFLEKLSQEILDVVEQRNTAQATSQELRKTLLVFLEMSLSKLVWSPEDGKDTWESVKTIAHHITRLIEHNVVDDPDDLNDLFITLIERYSYFLDITSTELSLDFYQKVKEDISSQSLLLLELEEQEDYIASKSEILLHNLTKAEATTRAYQKGIVIN